MSETFSYEAELEREYSLLTDKHKSIVSTLESSLSTYIKTGKGKPVTIQGPYGSGKTQLLYHLFKYVWSNNAIGIYTHLEKLLPQQVTSSSGDYTDYLKRMLNEEVQALRDGNSKLMSGGLSHLRDYALNHIGRVTDKKAPIFVFVDEIEQQYQTLDERVRTDDHSPLKATLRAVETGVADFYVVLAFAPVSFYEFSKGEAQTRSFLPLILPVLKADNLRATFGDHGNLVWWMGRGRFGWALKVFDTLRANLPNIDDCQKKELLDVCHNLGTIGGVPCLVGEDIERTEDFKRLRKFLVRMEPHHEGGETYVGDAKVIKKCRILGPEHDVYSIIEKVLAASRITGGADIAYYLSLILDALSNTKQETPLFTDAEDWRELFSMVSDITLEFEGQEKIPTIDIEKLRSDQDLPFNIRRDAENQHPLQEGYCLSPRFLRSLFPFPISSPNLVNKPIADQRETLGDQSYLAREEINGASVVVLLNDDKTKEYLTRHASEFLEETKALLIVNLGDNECTAFPSVAGWLQKEGRLRIANPRGILSDFIVSFIYWMRVEMGSSLPLSSLFNSLTDGEVSPDKEKARKIRYYASRVRGYIEVEKPKAPLPKYILKDQTGFDGKIGFFQQVLGFAFVDNKLDWEALYRFRMDFEKTEFVRLESNKRETGVPTALRNLAVETKGTVSQSSMLKRLNASFGKFLPDIKEIVKELERDKFTSIPTDDSSKAAFNAMYFFLKEYSDPSIATERLRETKSSWESIVARSESLSSEMRKLEKLFEQNVSLTHPLESDQVRLVAIGKTITEYENKVSPYTKFLLSILMEATMAIVETKLNELEKRFRELKDGVEDEISRYKSSLDGLSDFDKDTFKWVKKANKDLRDEFGAKLRDACQQLVAGGKLSLESIPDIVAFTEQLGNIADELELLSDINECMGLSKMKAKEIDKKLLAWEVK